MDVTVANCGSCSRVNISPCSATAKKWMAFYKVEVFFNINTWHFKDQIISSCEMISEYPTSSLFKNSNPLFTMNKSSLLIQLGLPLMCSCFSSRYYEERYREREKERERDRDREREREGRHSERERERESTRTSSRH